MDRTLWGGRLPWRRDWINDPDSSDPYLQEDFRGMLREIPNKVKLSVYVVEGHLRSWENLSAVAKAHSRLEIYPGNHGFAPSIYDYIEAKQVGYSTEHDALTERINEGHLPDLWVRYYVVGENRWKIYPAYPFAGKGSREIQPPNWRPDVHNFLSDPLNMPLGKLRIYIFIKVRTILQLFVPCFLFDRLCQYSLSKYKEYWHNLSNCLIPPVSISQNRKKKPEQFTKHSHLLGKWQLCYYPPVFVHWSPYIAKYP